MNACLTAEELASYNQGKLSEQRLDEVSEHLDSCPSCAAVASALDRENDDLMRDLRDAAASGKGPGPNASSLGAREEVQRQIGDYEIAGELGRGGMGVVYRARDGRLGRTVALKLLQGGAFADSRRRQRFRWEAEAVARLRHPGIVQIYEIGEASSAGESFPYIALEFLEGGSLKDRLAGGPLAPAEAARRVEEVARAVHYAHQQGIVHRDMKPSNILLAADGRALLCDFGIAKAEDHAERTETGQLLGTPEYMAPEQAAGSKEVGPAADVYGLGAILYELLSSRPPFRGPTTLDTLQLVLNAEPVPVRRLQPGVPRDLETICLKCLEKLPERRYRGADRVAEDLRRFLAGEPILAVPAGPLTRAAKWVRRKPFVATALLAVVLALSAGVGGIVWGLVRANRALAAEAAQRKQAETASQLFESVFQRLDPLALGNNDLREQLVAEMKRAEEHLDSEFANEPLLRARLRITLGWTQLGLSEPARAAALFQAALDEREAHLGKDHPLTWEARDKLAWAYRDLGKPADAIALFESVRAWKEENLGTEDPGTLETLNGLAGAYREGGRMPEAAALWRQAFDTSVRVRGPDDLRTLIMQANLGLVLQSTGHNAEAIAVLESIRGRQAEGFRDDHPRILTLLNNLAGAYLATGQTDKAVRLFEEVYAARSKKLGPDHQETISALNNIAASYLAAGRIADAAAKCEQARDRLTATVGPDHPGTLTIENNLGWMYRDVGRYEDALKLFTRVHQVMAKTLGAEHPDTLDAATGLAECWCDAGRPADAVKLLEQVLAARKKAGGTENADTLSTMSTLARMRLAQSKPEEALAAYREILAIQVRTLPDDPETVQTRTDVAFCLLQLGRYAEAEPLLRTSLTAREQATPDNWKTYHVRSLLGTSLLKQGKLAAAQPLLVTGYRGLNRHRERITAPNRIHLVKAAERLVELHEAKGNIEEAAKWRKELETVKTWESPRR
jgi:eukaryotic-like serine/threonine-protein kinase